MEVIFLKASEARAARVVRGAGPGELPLLGSWLCGEEKQKVLREALAIFVMSWVNGRPMKPIDG